MTRREGKEEERNEGGWVGGGRRREVGSRDKEISIK